MEKIILISMMVFLGSCIKLNKKNQSGDPAEAKKEIVENKQINSNSKNNMEYDFDLENSNSIIITSPVSWGNQFLIQQIQKEQILEQIIVFSPSGKSSIQLSKKINTKIPVLFKFFKISEDLKSSSEEMLLLHQEFILPSVNLDLDQDTYLDDIYLYENINKIYFTKLNLNNYKLYIKSFKGKFFIQNFESNYGSIQTYPENQKAELEKNGKQAGGFEVNIQKGKGYVYFQVNAENGGDGKSGNKPNPSLNGADGIDGAPAEFLQFRNDSCGANLLNLCGSEVKYECIKPPQKGQNGFDGLAGYSGTNAGNGGNVYKVMINNFNTELVYEINYKPGAKGIGGLGEQGGLGGNGGKGGDGALLDLLKNQNLTYEKYLDQKLYFHIGKTCQPALNGQPGRPGLNGRAGLDGQDGKILD